MTLTRSPTLPPRRGRARTTVSTVSGNGGVSAGGNVTSNIPPTNMTSETSRTMDIPPAVSAQNSPRRNANDSRERRDRSYDREEGKKVSEGDNGNKFGKENPLSAETGMDAAVKRLGDDVFTLWGGRSRTPSIDHERDNDDERVTDAPAHHCRGGPGKLHCGLVVDPAENGEAGIECDKCGDWYHAACQLVPKAAVTAVGKFAMIHWFCSTCRVHLFSNSEDTLKKVNDRLETLEMLPIGKMSEQIESMAKTVSEHMRLVNRVFKNQEEVAYSQEKLMERSLRELHEQKTSYADIVKGSCDQVMKDVSEQLNTMKKQVAQKDTSPAKDIYTTIGSVMDRERRKLNVVIHNLPESEPSEVESREQKDLSKFEETIKDAMHLRVQATKCFRVGRLSEDRPRLLIVTLSDYETKMELLRSSSQLRNTPEWQHLYINPDLTPAEREENRKLRQELASRRAAGEENISIRKGKIVKVSHNPQPHQQQQASGTANQVTQRSAEDPTPRRRAMVGNKQTHGEQEK